MQNTYKVSVFILLQEYYLVKKSVRENELNIDTLAQSSGVEFCRWSNFKESYEHVLKYAQFNKENKYE